MHMLFVDESGTPPPKDKVDKAPYFVLGGVIIYEDTWHSLDKAIRLLKAKYKVEGEIKWRYFAPQKPDSKTNLSHLMASEKESFRNAIYDLLNNFEVNAHCMAFDVQQMYIENINGSSESLYKLAYFLLVRQFDEYLYNRHIKNGIVICDNRLPKEDNGLRDFHHTVFPSLAGFSRHIIEGALITPSHFSLGVQLSDMINGAVYRKITKNDNRYFDKIKSLIVTNHENKSDWGVKGIINYQ